MPKHTSNTHPSPPKKNETHRDGADDDAAGVLGALEVVEEERDEEEVGEVVDLDRLLDAVRREGGHGLGGEVDGGVADQGVQGLAALDRLDVLGELAHRVEHAQLGGWVVDVGRWW